MDYTLGEELVNSISHGIGAGLGIAACVLCIIKAALSGNPWAVVSCSIFGATLILLYLNSTLYHALAKNKAKRVFRIIDHCSVFLLVAGTYTPYLFVSLHGAIGWVLFGIIWGLTAIGITLNIIDPDKYEIPSTLINVVTGWGIIFAYSPLKAAIGSSGIALLIIGGVVYTVGAVLYSIGDKVKYMHSIFHFFCIGGSILHFLSIYLYEV